MDYWARKKRFDKIALRIIRMLGASVVFVYSHAYIFVVAFVTALFASMQVWYDGAYNNVVAVLLAFSRLWLFGLILTTLTGHSIHNVSKGVYWKEVYGRARWRVKRLGAHRFFIETIFLFIVIISLGNFLVMQISNLAVIALPVRDHAAFQVVRSFLSHITIIPIGITFVMMMFGADQPVYAKKVPQ